MRPLYDAVPAAQVLDQVPAAVIAVDLDHVVTFWNAGAELLYGWPAAEALGRSVRELMLRGQPRADEVAAATHAGEVWEGELGVLHRDGSALLVYVRNAPLHDGTGQLVGVLGASMDVADLRRLEAHRAEAVTALADQAERAAARIGRLQRLTARLVGARTRAEVVDAVVEAGLGAAGAIAGAVNLVSDAGTHICVAGATGYAADQVEHWNDAALSVRMPVTEAVRSGQPVLYRNAAAWQSDYPDLPRTVPFEARAAIPIPGASGPVGALSLSYADAHDFDEDEVELLLTIARQCGQALERAGLLAAERSVSARNAFLAAASDLLTRSLSPERTLTALTELLVPRFADWVVVHLQEQDRAVTRAVAHRAPEVHAALEALSIGQVLDLEAEGGAAEALRTGASVLHTDVPAAMGGRVPLPDPHGHVAAALRPSTGLSVPLLAAGQLLGALSLARTEGPSYGPEDLEVVEQVAARAAVALSNARAYQRERESALTLQQSLLPQSLPQLPGLAFAWRYLPGAEGAQVGGDWYDVFTLDHGRVGLVIGDVMGRGVTAAAVMGQLRAMARAYAEAQMRPSDVLARLDAALSQLEQGAITTLLYVVVDPATSTVVAASAGHLPPLVLSPGTAGPGLARLEPGPPLGAGPGQYPEMRRVLPPASTLLLYTDGLVEDRTQSVDAGIEQLREGLQLAPAGDPDAVCDQALHVMGRDSANADDTALLAVSFCAGAARGVVEPFVSAVVRDSSETAELRRRVRRQAQLWHLPARVVDDSMLVLTELVSNALLHVGGEVTATVRLETERVRLEVRDDDPAVLPLPSLATLTETEGRVDDRELDAVIDELSISGTTGRGMTLVARLSHAWGVEQDPDGKLVWAELSLSEPDPRPARHLPEQGGLTAVSLRGVPVRLILASATSFDDVVRELLVTPQDGGVDRLGSEGHELLVATARTRDPLRAAARDALARGQRVVDVQTVAAPDTPDLLQRLVTLVARLTEGRMLVARPDPEVVAFRSWWMGEVITQLQGHPPSRCPFPALPSS